MSNLLTRGGVEDTRTNGSRPRPRKQKNPRPRTAVPRTDTLEAKDRNAQGQDKGHKRKCSQKKKGLQKFFSGDLHQNGPGKNFSTDLQNFNHSENS